MNSNTSLLPLSALAFTPAHTLKKKTIENAKLISHLEGLIRAEKFELGRLLAKHNSALTSAKSATSVPVDSNNPLQPFSSPVVTDPATVTSSSISDLQSPNYLKPNTPFHSPKGIMHSFSSPASTAVPTPASASDSDKYTPAPHQEMAARGSHWSFIEKARFEAAMLKYGPFAWDEIIKAVGSRTEKQVKAYAARYRRRKKLAARMQALPIISYPDVAMQMPHAQDHPTMTPTSFQQDRVKSMFPQPPTTQSPYQDCVRAFGVSRARIVPEPHKGAEAAIGLPTSDNVTEPSTQAHSECHSSAPVSVSAGEPIMDMFTQEMGEIEDSGMAKVEATDLCVEDGGVLDGVPENSAEVSQLASEVELLVDEAIGGGEDILGGSGNKPLVQFNEDPYPQDFINNWFNN